MEPGLALKSRLHPVVKLLLNLLILLMPHLLVDYCEVFFESFLLCTNEANVSKGLLGMCLPETKWDEVGSGL